MARLPDEFELIRRYFAPLTSGTPGAVGLRDDVATLSPQVGRELVVTADALVAGVHFQADDPPDLIARKALRVNLSDIAAKGGRARHYLMTLALGPEIDEAWIAAFVTGLGADQAEFGVSLAGGDTAATPGPVCISITVIGDIEPGTVLRRGGARAGDDVYVSGTIGDAALGLACLQGELEWLDSPAREELVGRYRLPRPRTTLGPRLIGLAHAALDVSDGLVADLGHMAEASSLSADIDVALVPLSEAARVVLAREPERLLPVLTGGDDYEILFAAPAGAAARLAALSGELGVPIARLGRLGAGRGVSVAGASGLALGRGGYRHF